MTGVDLVAAVKLSGQMLGLHKDLGNLLWFRVINEISLVPPHHLGLVAFIGIGRRGNACHHPAGRAPPARATRLHFAAADDTPPELTAAFTELREIVTTIAGERDVDTVTEVLWAALHGLVTLDRSGRLRPEYRTERADLLVAEFSAVPSPPK